MRATFYINLGAAILLRIARVSAKRTRSHDIVTKFANSHMLSPSTPIFQAKAYHHLLYAQTKPTLRSLARPHPHQTSRKSNPASLHIA
jgi:hypothetical protein